MLNSFWNWFVIIITVASILACWWLLHWTKGVSDRSGDEVGSTGHVWDEDLKELRTVPQCVALVETWLAKNAARADAAGESLAESQVA